MFKSLCRECKHSDEATHCSVIFCEYGIPSEPEYCQCPEYIPLDNLEYVEWSYLRSLK